MKNWLATLDRYALVRTIPVGHRTVTYWIPAGTTGQEVSAVVEWEPDRPSALTPEETVLLRREREVITAELGSISRYGVDRIPAKTPEQLLATSSQVPRATK